MVECFLLQKNQLFHNSSGFDGYEIAGEPSALEPLALEMEDDEEPHLEDGKAAQNEIAGHVDLKYDLNALDLGSSKEEKNQTADDSPLEVKRQYEEDPDEEGKKE